MGNIYDLDERVPIKKPVSSYDEAVSWDMSMRKGALVPYQKAGNRIAKLAKPEQVIVEVGSNTGTVAFYVSGQVEDSTLIGLEENEYMSEVANDNLNLLFWSNLDRDIEFQECSLSELPLDDEFADVVYSHSSLHLWSNPVATLKECKRICKKNGIIIIEDFDRFAEEGYISFVLQYIRDGADHFLNAIRAGYNKEEIKKVLDEAGINDWFIYTDELSMIVSSKELDEYK